ncbi:MAG: endonuclease/exonuclease/phosphatase family protein [Actinomycetota bacterium]
MRLVTYNIRNARALDPASWWWRRRRRLADVIDGLHADVVALQEAYPSQIRYLRGGPLASSDHELAGRGRNRDGGGEAVPIFTRTSALRRSSEETIWFGPNPDRPGSRDPGASHPRIATIATYDVVGSDGRLRVVNLHLDPASVDRRTESVRQLLASVGPVDTMSTVVVGDFNGPLDEPWSAELTAAGFRSALPADAGPTSNGFGDPGGQQQIDHVFVDRTAEVVAAEIVTAAGHASDHYPVLVELSFGT